MALCLFQSLSRSLSSKPSRFHCPPRTLIPQNSASCSRLSATHPAVRDVSSFHHRRRFSMASDPSPWVGRRLRLCDTRLCRRGPHPCFCLCNAGFDLSDVPFRVCDGRRREFLWCVGVRSWAAGDGHSDGAGESGGNWTATGSGPCPT